MNYKFVFLVSLMLVFSLGIVAQDMPQNGLDYSNVEFDDLNWCFTGQRWEGQCNLPGLDSFEVDWMWGCGWYFAHLELGLLTGVPGWCAQLDADGDGIFDNDDPCPFDAANKCNGGKVIVGPAPGCYDLDLTLYDQYYFGPINTPGNVHAFGSGTNDGTCAGGATYTAGMWVYTLLTDKSQVIAYCNTIGSGFDKAIRLVDYNIDPTVSSTYWACYW